MNPHRTVAKAEWIEVRRALLAREKELTRLRDRLAQEQRALPWVKIEKSYVFDGLEGKITLAELFDAICPADDWPRHECPGPLSGPGR
jgi:predicted dithiol-disulfide oxidoreductase (DUF899 family)